MSEPEPDLSRWSKAGRDLYVAVGSGDRWAQIQAVCKAAPDWYWPRAYKLQTFARAPGPTEPAFQAYALMWWWARGGSGLPSTDEIREAIERTYPAEAQP